MTNEEIKSAVSAVFPTVAYDETGEFLNILIAGEELKPLIKTLRYNKEYDFDFLFCLTCIDWKTHLNMVYHLLSKKHRHAIVLKAKIADINKPEIATVCDIYQTANFHEREVYDLFGVNFKGHPDMRRLFLDESWDGYPLRKNYVDENMISI
jgi:NADH-quinone oxidoreductase subunit C